MKYADEAFHVGEAHPSKSYLNMERIIDIAKKSGAEAVHPGYGFLAENYRFAKLCLDESVIFVGPRWKTIQAMGSKIGSKQMMKEAGVPVLPGTDTGITDIDEAKKVAAEIGYPVIVKASAGGGGIGMQIVDSEQSLEEAVTGSQRIAKSAFGDATVFIEKYLVKPRHIEFQVLADEHGNAVHLYDRECSIQRRHQKLIEEAPSPIMTPELRERMSQSAVRVAEASDYSNAGSVEFLYSQGNYYFMEMNTRLQVEHTITEFITGIDLVKQQIAIAAGESLPFGQEDLSIRGHAIECRINAEDPLNNFAADPGKIVRYRSPGGPGIRVDSRHPHGVHDPPELRLDDREALRLGQHPHRGDHADAPGDLGIHHPRDQDHAPAPLRDHEQPAVHGGKHPHALPAGGAHPQHARPVQARRGGPDADACRVLRPGQESRGNHRSGQHVPCSRRSSDPDLPHGETRTFNSFYVVVVMHFCAAVA